MSDYGPNVPVGRFCESLRAWGEAIRNDDSTDRSGERDARLVAVPALLDQLQLPMTKSNLLYRLIYLGEPLRTTKCPTHRGHWSGCSWSHPYCDCQKVIFEGDVGYGCNVTGWLLEDNPPVTARCGTRSIRDAPAEGYAQDCTLVAGHAGECVFGPWRHYQTGAEWSAEQ